jgi:hypothetical protein
MMEPEIESSHEEPKEGELFTIVGGVSPVVGGVIGAGVGGVLGAGVLGTTVGLGSKAMGDSTSNAVQWGLGAGMFGGVFGVSAGAKVGSERARGIKK